MADKVEATFHGSWRDEVLTKGVLHDVLTGVATDLDGIIERGLVGQSTSVKIMMAPLRMVPRSLRMVAKNLSGE